MAFDSGSPVHEGEPSALPAVLTGSCVLPAGFRRDHQGPGQNTNYWGKLVKKRAAQVLPKAGGLCLKWREMEKEKKGKCLLHCSHLKHSFYPV